MQETSSAGWPSVVLIYSITVLSMGTVGAVAALVVNLSGALGAKPAEVGLAISMFSLPSALLAALSGSVIDRFGAKRALCVSTLIGAIGCPLIAVAPSILALQGALLLAGLAFTGITVAAPAYFIAATTETLRIRAMSLWSTYPPTGFAVGLLLAAPFAGGEHWRGGVLALGCLMAIAGMLTLRLPAAARAEPAHAGLQLSAIGRVMRNPKVLQLGAAIAVPSAVSYGISLVAPSYLSDMHGVNIAASSLAVAAAKGVAMLLCGLIMGYILAKLTRVRGLFAAMALVGFAAQALLFLPIISFTIAATSLFVWLLAFGGLTTTAMAQLPNVADDPAHRGLVSGVIGQCISIASFMAPSIYFGMPHWTGFLAAGGIGLLIAVLALPVAADASQKTATLEPRAQTAE
jgi:MFS family permease